MFKYLVYIDNFFLSLKLILNRNNFGLDKNYSKRYCQLIVKL